MHRVEILLQFLKNLIYIFALRLEGSQAYHYQ